jgi:hypothetical protein
MKKLLFTFFIALGLLTSCVKPPVEDPDPLPPAGNVTADFDGLAFESTSEQVVIDNSSMSLNASREDGSYFKITLPEAPMIGTYNWSVYDPTAPGLYLAYFESPDAVPYVAARDNIGEFASFSSYTDTAEIVVLGIDTSNKRISGTFKFTGVRFTDDTHTAVETKVFTNGTFFNIPYTSAPVVNPSSTVLIKKVTETNADNSVYTIEYFYIGSKINYWTDSEGNRNNYTYTGNLVTKEELVVGTTLTERTTYEYNSSSKLITYISVNLVDDTGTRITYVHNSNGTIFYQEYSGNSDAQEEMGSSGLLTSTTHVENYTDPNTLESQVFTGGFTFDTKNNPFKNVIGYDKVYFADSDMPLNYANNVLQHTDQIDASPSYILETMTYTYNPTTNYPTKIVTRNGAGDIQSTEDIIYY